MNIANTLKYDPDIFEVLYSVGSHLKLCDYIVVITAGGKYCSGPCGLVCDCVL